MKTLDLTANETLKLVIEVNEVEHLEDYIVIIFNRSVEEGMNDERDLP